MPDKTTVECTVRPTASLDVPHNDERLNGLLAALQADDRATGVTGYGYGNDRLSTTFQVRVEDGSTVLEKASKQGRTILEHALKAADLDVSIVAVAVVLGRDPDHLP